MPNIAGAATVAALILAQSSRVLAFAMTQTTLHDTLPRGATLEVRALDGSIEVRRGSGPATVVAKATPHDGFPIDMHVAQTRLADRWFVCAVSLSQRTCSDDDGDHGDTHTRIDFIVTLPPGVRLKAEDVSGNITARALASDVEAHAVSGNVSIVTSGTATAQTVSGALDVSIGRIDDRLAFDSVSGGVRLAVPANASAEIAAQSVSGAVRGSGGLAFAGEPQMVGSNVRAKLGDGGPHIDIHTVSGSIDVRTR
jgi:hypothetical protein